MLPIATFLAGALLTLLMPTALLTGLVIWYMRTVKRVPSGRPEDLGAAATPPAPDGPTGGDAAGA